MATELAVGYVSVVPSAQGFYKKLSGQVSGPAQAVGASASKSITSSIASGLSRVASGVLNVVKTTAKVGAVTATAFGGAALVKGYQRLSTIENSTKSLTIALGSSDKAAGVLGKTLDVVKGTPFALDQFADATQQLVTMGVSADKVPGYLTAIGDAAATKGSQANEFAARLSTQFGQIQAQGRITGEDILQMSQTGVNALAILANHYGVNTTEMQKMISKGLVPAGEGLDVLSAGIEKGSNGLAGMTPALGGLSKKLGDTASGSLANLGAAFSRFGAKIIGPIFDKIPPLANAASGALDVIGGAVGGVISKFVNSKGFSDGFTHFVDWIKTNAPVVAMYIVSWSEKFGGFIDKVKNSQVVQDFLDKVKGFSLSGGISKLGDFIKNTLVPQLEKLKPAAKNIIDFLKNLKTAGKTSGKGVLIAAVAGLPAFTTLVNTLTGLVAKVPPNVLVAIFAAVSGFKVVKGAADGLSSISDGIGGIVKSGKSVTGTISTIKDGIGGLAKTHGISKASAAFKVLKSSIADTKIGQFSKGLGQAAKKGGQWVTQNAKIVAGLVKQGVQWVALKAKVVAEAVAKKVAAAAQWLWNAAMDANPIGLIVLGIAALIAGLVLAYNKVGWFRDFVNAVFSGIKTVVLGVVHFFQTNWSTITAVLSAPFQFAKAIIDGAISGVKAVVSGVFNWVKTNWPLLLAILTGPIGMAVLIIVKNWDTIKNAFTAVKNWISDRVGDIVGFITGIPGRIQHTVSTLWDGLKSGITSAKNWVRDRVTDIVGYFTGLPHRMAHAFTGLFDGIKDAFRSAVNWIIDRWNGLQFKVGAFDPPGPGPKFGGVTIGVPNIPRLHTGGLVPGGANNEPLYRLQGGEGVIPRDGMAVLAKLFGRSPSSPDNAGAARSVTGVHADKIVIEDPTTAEQFFRYAEMKMTMAAL